MRLSSIVHPISSLTEMVPSASRDVETADSPCRCDDECYLCTEGASPASPLIQVCSCSSRIHLKCQRALALWRSGMNFTELAVAAGFYDQPHLNRTLRAMFDALPSRYARGLPVQVVHLKE